ASYPHAVEAQIRDAACECCDRLLYCGSRLGKHAFDERWIIDTLVGGLDSVCTRNPMRYLTTQDKTCSGNRISRVKEVRNHSLTYIAETKHPRIRTIAADDDTVVVSDVKNTDFALQIFDAYARYRLIVDLKRNLQTL